MRRLLTHLAQFSAFSKQGEVLCTRGLEYLLENEGAREAFGRHLSRDGSRELSRDLHWRAELRQQDNARPDLEGCTGARAPAVKVEAKLGAALGQDQLHAYADDLVARSGGGHLLVLVPRYRVEEAKEVVASCTIPDTVSTMVSSWEDVIDHLRHLSAESFAGDLAQFEAMYRVLCGEDTEPLADEEAIRAWRDREHGFIGYIDRATRVLAANGRLLPLALEIRPKRSHAIKRENPAGEVFGGSTPYLDSRVPDGGYLRRYVVCIEQDPSSAYFSLGVRDPFEDYVTPIWLRFHSKTGSFPLIRERLRSAPQPPRMVELGGHIWIPIEVPLNAEATLVIESIVEQAGRVVAIARGEAAPGGSDLSVDPR